MQRLYQRFSILGLILVTVLAFSGCATKKYVRNQVSTVDPKIAQVNASIDQTNGRVDEIDRRAQGASATAQGASATAQGASATADAADRKATAALQAASAADSKATAAMFKADSADGVQQANNRMKSSDTRGNSRDGYTTTSPVMIMFAVNSAALDGTAKQHLDGVVATVAGQSDYMIEIHGFTDSTGSDRYNTVLSHRRAESALHYLVGKGVPSHQISVIGMGERMPIASNNVAGGREQNRRVEVRVMQSTAPRSN